MKHLQLTVVIALTAFATHAATPSTSLVSVDAGSLHLALDGSGKLAALTGPDGRNQLAVSGSSTLLMLQAYGDANARSPVALRQEALPAGGMRLLFSYGGGFSATVDITPRAGYVRLELVKAEPLKDIQRITWGPLHTTMKGPLGEYAGLIREGDFTVGMMSLEPNTDGLSNNAHFFVARYDGCEGSSLIEESFDHTRTRNNADAVPGVTVQGSAIALFGCANKEELDRIEAVELGEKLPHPTTAGVWNKRSDDYIYPIIWQTRRALEGDACLETARLFGAHGVCYFRPFGNWGHFEPDPGQFPKGMASLRETVAQAKAEGLDYVIYTLSTFLKTFNASTPEPFIAPAASPELQYTAPPSSLANALDEKSNTLVLKVVPGFAPAKGKELRVDGEIIMCGETRTEGGNIIVSGCTRGYRQTHASSHSAGEATVLLGVYFDHSVCPRTLSLQDAVADNIARVVRDSGSKRLVIDGYESCVITGHGAYAKNRFSKRLYDAIGSSELSLTPSNFGNYDWHTMAYASWGELDREKGFRGTMIDYRLRRQVQLENNRMPHRMGQYYPEMASGPEDMDWLMAVATGFDAGVDFHFFHANPADAKMKSLAERVRLWTDARRAGFFTDSDKLRLRQTDCIWSLDKKKDGHYALNMIRRWMSPGVEILPPSVFRITPIGSAAVAPLGIDWSWTHNPAVAYRNVGLSDDLVANADGEEAQWQVTYPGQDRLQFVIRLPENAPCAVRNPEVTLGDGKMAQRLVIPVTLQPGQYLSVPHDMARVCIYGKDHEVIGESAIQCLAFRLPAVSGGKPQTIGLSAEPVEPSARPVLRMNLRCHQIIGEDN